MYYRKKYTGGGSYAQRNYTKRYTKKYRNYGNRSKATVTAVVSKPEGLIYPVGLPDPNNPYTKMFIKNVNVLFGTQVRLTTAVDTYNKFQPNHQDMLKYFGVEMARWHWFRCRELTVKIRTSGTTVGFPEYVDHEDKKDYAPVPITNYSSYEPRVLALENYAHSTGSAFQWDDFIRRGATEYNFNNGRCAIKMKWPKVLVDGGSNSETEMMVRAKWMSTNAGETNDPLYGILWMVDSFNTNSDNTPRFVYELTGVFDFCHLRAQTKVKP